MNPLLGAVVAARPVPSSGVQQQPSRQRFLPSAGITRNHVLSLPPLC